MGFQKIIEEKQSLEKLKIADLFKKIGMLIMSTVGGSSGVLYGGTYISISMGLRLLKLNQITIDWINYFSIARAKGNIQNMDGLGEDLEHVFGNNGNYQ